LLHATSGNRECNKTFIGKITPPTHKKQWEQPRKTFLLQIELQGSATFRMKIHLLSPVCEGSAKVSNPVACSKVKIMVTNNLLQTKPATSVRKVHCPEVQFVKIYKTPPRFSNSTSPNHRIQ
jgi:hypothetical protein